jgi:hypothetical protein
MALGVAALPLLFSSLATMAIHETVNGTHPRGNHTAREKQHEGNHSTAREKHEHEGKEYGRPALCVLPLAVRGCSADEKGGIAQWEALALVCCPRHLQAPPHHAPHARAQVCVAIFTVPVSVALMLIARDRVRSRGPGRHTRLPTQPEQQGPYDGAPKFAPFPESAGCVE